MKLRGSVIIIGSLLWDDKNCRGKWRKNHLLNKDKFQVYLPIRYGRCSCSRKKTHTMVFSDLCRRSDYGLGKGWILPIRAKISSFDDLKREAEEMGKAEGYKNKLFSAWGSVALLINPNSNKNPNIKRQWRELLQRNEHINELSSTHLKSEKPAIDSDGFLKIRWPREFNPEGKLKSMDFLIATVTKPHLIKSKRYPTVNQIAGAMKKANYDEYFIRNREHEITTFQDERILKKLNH